MNADQPLLNVENVLDNTLNELIIEDDDSETLSTLEEQCKAQWYYFHKEKWFKYNKVMNAQIENAYKAGKKRMDIKPPPKFEYIDFTQMMAICASAHIPNATLKRVELEKDLFPKILPPLSKHVRTGLAMKVAHDIFNKALTYLDNHSPGMVDDAQDKKQNELFILKDESSKCNDYLDYHYLQDMLADAHNKIKKEEHISKGGSSKYNIASHKVFKETAKNIEIINIDKPVEGSLIDCDINEVLNLAELLLNATEQNIADVDEETVKLLEDSKTDMEILDNITQYSAYEDAMDDDVLCKSVI